MELQQDYTTIEQSKRLLELGIPANSHNCFYVRSSKSLDGNYEYHCYMGQSIAIKNNLFSYRNGHVIPAWTSGRLMEIVDFCLYDGYKDNDPGWLSHNRLKDGESYIEYIIDVIKQNIMILQFSKLDD